MVISSGNVFSGNIKKLNYFKTIHLNFQKAKMSQTNLPIVKTRDYLQMQTLLEK